ncbi:hypothetical protein AB0G00_27545 [Nocardia salmonicida]|uniref:hypothetical protein n=1 Tax=Nocardia salmonicida TaxID=53431 RepID=UPI0034058EBB
MAYIVLNAGFSTALRAVKMEEEGMDRDAVIDQTADMIGLWISAVALEGSPGTEAPTGAHPTLIARAWRCGSPRPASRPRRTLPHAPTLRRHVAGQGSL